MTSPLEASSSTFLVEPKNKGIAEGQQRLLPAAREFRIMLAPILGAIAVTLGACAYAAWTREAGTGVVTGVLAAVALMGTIVLLVKNGSAVFRAIRLARHGKLLPGEVIFCAGTRNDQGDLVVNMKYRFTSPEGKALEAVHRFSGHRLPGETLPSPRTTLAVYYAADDCYLVL